MADGSDFRTYDIEEDVLGLFSDGRPERSLHFSYDSQLKAESCTALKIIRKADGAIARECILCKFDHEDPFDSGR